MKAVLILSGGMDSTTLLYELLEKGYKVHALTIDYKQKHRKEIIAAKKTCRKLRVEHLIIDLSCLGNKIFKGSALTSKKIVVPEGNYTGKNMKKTVVPNRNMIFLSIAAAYAFSIGAKKIFYGAHSGDHAIYPDCRKEFIYAMKKAINLAGWKKADLAAPYLYLDKGEIAIKGKKLGVDYSLTWTCYKGKTKACGRCGACRERIEAFKKANMMEPLKYENL